jgi:hypothetical protein
MILIFFLFFIPVDSRKSSYQLICKNFMSLFPQKSSIMKLENGKENVLSLHNFGIEPLSTKWGAYLLANHMVFNIIDKNVTNI